MSLPEILLAWEKPEEEDSPELHVTLTRNGKKLRWALVFDEDFARAENKNNCSYCGNPVSECSCDPNLFCRVGEKQGKLQLIKAGNCKWCGAYTRELFENGCCTDGCAELLVRNINKNSLIKKNLEMAQVNLTEDEIDIIFSQLEMQAFSIEEYSRKCSNTKAEYLESANELHRIAKKLHFAANSEENVQKT